MRPIPKHITLRDQPKLQRWLNDLRDLVYSLRPLSMHGGQLDWTANGVNWRVKPGQPGGAGASIEQFAVTAEQVATLTCTTNGSDTVTVAKPLHLTNVSGGFTEYAQTGGGTLQMSYLPLVIAGVTSANKRLSTLGAFNNDGTSANTIFHEVIYEPYVPAPFGVEQNWVPNWIWAVQIPRELQVGGVEWLDLNIDARRWVKETVVCTGATGNAMMLALADISCPYPASQSIDFTVV